MVGAAVRILLLRGINVGAHNRIPMPALRDALSADGFGDVRTYVQSGNIVAACAEPPEAVADRARRVIAASFGLDIPVVARTRDELADVVANDPLDGEAVVEKLYQVTFLDREPPAEVVDRLAALTTPTERFIARGREWYTYYPDGIAKSKLAARSAAKSSKVVATARNWTTVRTLLAMADGEL